MPVPDIHTTIADLASLYDNLNDCWNNDTCATDVYQVYQQKKYRDIFETIGGINIESIAIKIIADSINDKVLNRLRGLLQENILIYEAHQEDFKKIDFDRLYPLWEEHLFGNKRALLLKDRETIKDYPYPTEREREILLKENQQDINEIDNERNKLYRSDAAWIRKSYYSDIYELSRSFIFLLENYFPVEKEKELKEIKPTIKPGLFFDMQLASLIHNECNNIQFDNLSEIDLYSILNLQPANAKLTIKSGERTRMCYLIYKLYEYLKTENRTNWRTAILEVAGIDKKYYDSKYKAPISEIPSRKSESFAQRINKIFEYIS